MAEALLKLSGVTAGYGDVQVLWGVGLEVNKGEITCIIGSNGAGKTTLLKAISGLVRMSGGTASFLGHAIEKAGPSEILRLGIAHVPEGRRLFKGLSVQDNLLLGAYLRSDTKAAAQDLERVYMLFPILAERRFQDAATLSGGEQQMCAIGRGMMSRPSLLLIDELSLGLAPQAVERLAVTLENISRLGVTVLLVEQDVFTALDLAQRGYVLETGRVSISGDTKTLASDPAIRQAYMGL
jgi:branched-chain amino acid transport system ATP-binding protein